MESLSGSDTLAYYKVSASVSLSQVQCEGVL